VAYGGYMAQVVDIFRKRGGFWMIPVPFDTVQEFAHFGRLFKTSG